MSPSAALWVRNGFRPLSYFDLFVLVPFWSLLAAVWCSLLVLPMAMRPNGPCAGRLATKRISRPSDRRATV